MTRININGFLIDSRLFHKYELAKVTNMVAKGYSRVCSWLKSNWSGVYIILLIGCIVFLLGETLYKNVFCCLWDFLSLQDNMPLKCTVACVSLYCAYWGLEVSRKVLDKCHIVTFVMVLLVYIYYKFNGVAIGCSMILLWGKIDSFEFFFLSFFLGYLFGKLNRHCQYKNHCHNGTKSTFDAKHLRPIPLYLDEPIDSKKDDLFRYSVLAKRLAYTIKEKAFSKSYSIGVSAPWGSGKSSFLNLLRTELVNIPNIIVIDFNARSSATAACIQSDFLSILASSLSPYHTGMKSTIKEYMDDINVLANDTPWMKLIGLVDIKDATNSRVKLQEGISSIGKKLVVLIDDLDRLMVDEILEVLKLITKNAAFNNTVFVTTYDKRYINGNLGKVLCVPQKQCFSDKYFNMEIDLPEGNRSVRSSYLRDKIVELNNNDFITACKEQNLLHDLSEVAIYTEKYLPTLRDVKRFLNSFSASYIPIQDEVYFKEYFLVSLIRYAHQNLYDNLKKCGDIRLNDGGNIYVLEDSAKKSTIYDILCELFPENNSVKLSRYNETGQKHIYWKRSFGVYFYNLDNTYLLHTDISELLKPNIKDEDIRSLSVGWRNRGILVDIKDFFVGIREYQKNMEQLESYLKLCIMCYRYTKENDMFYLSSRYFFDYNKAFEKKYGFKDKKAYKEYLRKILVSEKDINATSFFLHHLLSYKLSEIHLGKENCVFTDDELKNVCLDRFNKGMSLFERNEIKAFDVLYLAYGCLDEADFSDCGNRGYQIMPYVLEKIKESIKQNPQEYLDHVVCHKFVGNDRVSFRINDDVPLTDVLDLDELKTIISSINTDGNSSLNTICNFWMQYIDLSNAQKSPSPTCSFKGEKDRLEMYNYSQYNLIFEGEAIE